MACKEVIDSVSAIVSGLNIFEKAPKGNPFDNGFVKWFEVGEQVFQDFYKLGIALDWKGSAIKLLPEYDEVVAAVTKNEDWLQSFLVIYGLTQVEMDEWVPGGDMCKVRSGIEFLLQEFGGTSSDFDTVLENLKNLGEIEEFDSRLKDWVDSYFRANFFPGELHPSTPKNHWWWYSTKRRNTKRG